MYVDSEESIEQLQKFVDYYVVKIQHLDIEN